MFTHTLFGIATFAISGLVFAQMSPVGTWNSIDDKTKELKSEIVITDAAGVVSGKVTKQIKNRCATNVPMTVKTRLLLG
jgi:hypothetical protein